MRSNPLRLAPVLLITLLLPALLAAQEEAGYNPFDTVQIDTSYYRNTISGEFTPGRGFDLVKTKIASLNLSVYGLARYLNQLPASQSFTDHLGRIREVDTRHDIQWHRAFIWVSGYFLNPKLRYTVSVWGLASTGQVLLFGNMQYQLHRAVRFGVGIGPNLGSRSLQGSWPFMMAADRLMVDDFFRPGFTGGFWVTGEPLPGFNYNFMIGDNLSILGISSSQLTRDLSKSVSLWWMPTTGEFGPRGGFSDFEIHEKVATRIGMSYTYAREDRFNAIENPSPANTQIRLSDGVLFFETGALAEGVTVQKATYNLLAFDAGVKYKGLAVTGEMYFRRLSDFVADGELPIEEINDSGFYLQASYPIVKKMLEAYVVSGYVMDDFKRNPWELGGGMNFYPSRTRSWRINTHLLRVEKSPAGSLFGYYLGGLTGTVFSIGTDLLL